ncbi:MAG TPA: hypothetical protein VIM53_01460 [Candidatus Saccharimonadales bacterium]
MSEVISNYSVDLTERLYGSIIVGLVDRKKFTHPESHDRKIEYEAGAVVTEGVRYNIAFGTFKENETNGFFVDVGTPGWARKGSIFVRGDDAELRMFTCVYGKPQETEDPERANVEALLELIEAIECDPDLTRDYGRALATGHSVVGFSLSL